MERPLYFKRLQECRQWLEDAQFEDEHGTVLQGENPTADAWYQYWIENRRNDRLTMNLYVHVTDEEKEKEAQNVGKMLKII